MKKLIVPAAVALLLIFGACPKAKDTISPTVAITAPANGDTLIADTITITAHATDNKGVTAVRFFVDTTELAPDSTPESGNYSAVWSAVAETLGGAFKIKARASDSAGNFADDSVIIYIRKTGGGPKYHGGALTASEIWYMTGNPHICTTAVVIDGGHKLTIEPGCEVRFRAGAGIVIGQGSGGELAAVGKPDTLIQFTSDSSAPSPGNWTGIAFYANTAATTHLSYCGLDYGGVSSGGALVANPGAQFSVDHCTIAHGAGSGLFCAIGGHPTAFTDNTITGSLNYAVRVEAGYIGSIGSGNVLTGNAPGMDAIFVAGSGVVASATWRNLGVPYVLNGDVSIGGVSQPVVTIEPGTTIKLGQNTTITVGYNLLPGGLKADATGGQQILFTSTLATPHRGDWLYIYFDLGTIDSESKLKNCKFQFGGGNQDGEIYLYDANPEISGCAVDSSAGYGIFLDGDFGNMPDTLALRANNTFSGNANGDVGHP